MDGYKPHCNYIHSVEAVGDVAIVARPGTATGGRSVLRKANSETNMSELQALLIIKMGFVIMKIFQKVNCVKRL